MTGPAAEQIAAGVLRVTAPNPGPMTGPGTNSYIVGTGPRAIIDPGVNDPAHLAALREAAPGPLSAILITHAHPDHTGGAAELAAATGAPVRAHPRRLEGVRDESLRVDTPIAEGDTLALGDVMLSALHTPGHTADHLCFYTPEHRMLFAGDSVMADVTVVILPPDGSMSDYLASLARLERMTIDTIAPGHGRLLDNAPAELEAILEHRQQRERQVYDAIQRDTPRTARAIAAELYPALGQAMQAVAAAQVEAHLVRLAELGRAEPSRSGWRALAGKR